VLATYPNDVVLAFVNFPLSKHAYALPQPRPFSRRPPNRRGRCTTRCCQSVSLDRRRPRRVCQVIGLDLVQFDADRSSQKSPTRWRRTKPWRFLGVDATPTFFIAGSWIVGDQPSRSSRSIETAPDLLLHHLVQSLPRGARRHTVVVSLGGCGSRRLASSGLSRRSRSLGKTVIRQEEAQPAQRALEVGRVVHGGGQPALRYVSAWLD